MNSVATQTMSAIETALVTGDLSKLSTEQCVSYYNQICSSLGLNALTKPFQYLILNGKKTLYATKDCTDQLRTIHKVSIKIVDVKKIDEIYVVTAEGTNKDGRTDSSTGCVNVAGLKGDNLANAFMKAETKSKRRVTLSLCGLGLLDESEVDSIAGAQKISEHEHTSDNSGSIDVVPKIEPIPKGKAKNISPAEDAEGYIIDLGPNNKMTGTKLDEHKDSWIRTSIEKTIAWHTDNKRDMHPNTKEFVLQAEQHLAKKNPPAHDRNEQLR